MMKLKIDPSTEEQIERLMGIFHFETKNLLVRTAIACSIQNGDFYEEGVYSPSSNAKEWRNDRSTFGTVVGGVSNAIIYKTIIEQYYNKTLYENEFSKVLYFHLRAGIELLNKTLEKHTYRNEHYLEVLLQFAEKGLANVTKKTSSRNMITRRKINSIQTVGSYGNAITLKLGYNEKQEEVVLPINDLTEFDSNHIAVAGMTGSGKTQIVKNILWQITQQTEGKVKFIFLDYKGESKDKVKDFLEVTDCRFIDILQDKFSFNPFGIIASTEHKNERSNEINAFVDMVCGLANLGTKQSMTLRTIIRAYFEEEENGVPTVKKIYESLLNDYQSKKQKHDTLIDIFDKLTTGVFTDEISSSEKEIYEENIYLNLPSSASDTVRLLSVFFVLNFLLSTFSKMPDTEPDNSGIKPMRYIIVVDEAHVYLKNKRARSVLENILRVLRSKGVMVIMISQGVEDYKQKDFDFSSQVKIPICLNTKNKDYKIIESFLGTPSSKYKLEQAISKLTNGGAILNYKEPQNIKADLFWQTLKKLNT